MSFIKVLCYKQNIKQKKMPRYYYFTFILTKLELGFLYWHISFPWFQWVFDHTMKLGFFKVFPNFGRALETLVIEFQKTK